MVFLDAAEEKLAMCALSGKFKAALSIAVGNNKGGRTHNSPAWVESVFFAHFKCALEERCVSTRG
jgi:hypothetical protein